MEISLRKLTEGVLIVQAEVRELKRMFNRYLEMSVEVVLPREPFNSIEQFEAFEAHLFAEKGQIQILVSDYKTMYRTAIAL